MQAQRTATGNQWFSQDRWLMLTEDDGGATYVQMYRHPLDANRAARDLNEGGCASHPAEYERLRRRRSR